MRIHIAHVLSSFAVGGQERMALDLATSQVRAGYEVLAVSLAPAPDGPLAGVFRAAGVVVDRVPRPRPGVDPMLVLRLARRLQQRRATLAHTHNRMALIYGAPAAWLAGARVVHTKHGNNPKGGTRLLAGNLAGRLVDAFVAVSPETADVARLRREIDERRLSVIPNGVDVASFRPDPAARARIRRELGIDDDAWVFGTVGRIAKEKNQALLVRAAAPLLGPKVRLVLAGDGPLLPSLSELVRSLGIAAFVHLLGMRRDVPDVLNALDVFVLCSDTEGLPLAIAEAMAVALPVVSTRVGGIPTVLEEEQTGFLIPAGDEAALLDRLRRLRAAPALARACGERARATAVERFSAERMHRDYLDLYQRVLSNG